MIPELPRLDGLIFNHSHLQSFFSWRVYTFDLGKNIIAVCKDNYGVYACGFDQVGKWSGFAESMRINEDH